MQDRTLGRNRDTIAASSRHTRTVPIIQSYMFPFGIDFLLSADTIVNIAGISVPPLLSKVAMDKIAERRKRTAFAIVFVVFLGVVVVTLLWALDII